MNPVAIRPATYERMEPTVAEFLDAFAPELRGKTVLVKPNMLSNYPPERHVTTHPSIVRALVRALRARGANAQVGDNPGLSGYGSNERCAAETGIAEAAEGAYVNIGQDVVQVDVDSPRVRKLPVSRAVLGADLVISVPKFKTHVLTTLSGAIKNHYGIVVGGEKARLHLVGKNPGDFAALVVDVYAVRPPDLVIVDAVVGIEGLGPVGKRTRNIGKLIAADNGVAADAVMARMMGLDPASITHLRLAAERGLGPLDPATDPDPVEPIGGFLRPWEADTLSGRRLTQTRAAFRVLGRPTLRVDRRACTACETCAEKCPADAIRMKEHAVIDAKKCVRCFCCYEVCPDDAIRIRGLLSPLLPGHAAPEGEAS